MWKQFFRFNLAYLLLSLFIAYWGAWYDLSANGEVNLSDMPNLMSSIIKSFSYLVQWVLPYWWLVITGSTIVLSMITVGFIRIIKGMKNK